MGPRDGGEILVAQFELNGAREISTLAQPPPNHLAETHQRGLQALGVARVFVERVLVADRLRIYIFAHFIVEPSSSVFAPRLPGQCESPFSEAMFEIVILETRQIPNFLNTDRV